MSDFKALIKKVIGDKKEYKEYKRRIAALPAEYRQVFQEIEKYAWHFWFCCKVSKRSLVFQDDSYLSRDS